MKYMGSKSRLVRHVKPILDQNRTPNQCYVEPFIGGANMFQHISGQRIGADAHYYLIKALQKIQSDPAALPDLVTEDDYSNIKGDMHSYEPWLVGYVGFSMSFGGKWWGGYRRDVAGSKGCMTNMQTQSRRSKQRAIAQSLLLATAELRHCDYTKLILPRNSLIYCDPPHANPTKYTGTFDHRLFWDWCESMRDDGHTVFVSEYTAPDWAIKVWSKDLKDTLSENTTLTKTDCLFRV